MKFHRITLFLVLVLINLIGFGQQLDFISNAGAYTGGHQDISRCVFRDSNKNYYQLGSSADTTIIIHGLTAQNPYGNSTNFHWLVKLDSNFTPLWVSTFKYNNTNIVGGDKIAVDNIGNIYVTDTHWGTAEIGAQTILNSGLNNMTFKLDSNGNVIWVKSFGGRKIEMENGSLRLFGVRSLNDTIGTTYITNINGTTCLLDTAGNVTSVLLVNDWYPTEMIWGRKTNGHYYGRRATAAQNVEHIIWDSNGVVIDSASANSNGIKINDMVYDQNFDKYYVSGQFMTIAGWKQFRLTKLNGSLQLEAQVNLCDSFGTNFTTNNQNFNYKPYNGELYLAGLAFQYFTHLGTGQPMNSADDNIVFAKFDANLNLDWFDLWPTANFANMHNSIIVDEDGMVSSGSAESFAHGSIVFNVNGGSSTDVFLVRHKDTGVVTGQESNSLMNTDVVIYPNPTQGQFTILLNKFNAKASVVVYSVIGKEIIRQKLINTSTQIDLSNYDKGIYFVKIQNGGQSIGKRIINQ